MARERERRLERARALGADDLVGGARVAHPLGRPVRLHVGAQLADVLAAGVAACALAASRPAHARASSSRMPGSSHMGPPPLAGGVDVHRRNTPAGRREVVGQPSQVNDSAPVKRCDVSSSGLRAPMTGTRWPGRDSPNGWPELRAQRPRRVQCSVCGTGRQGRHARGRRARGSPRARVRLTGCGGAKPDRSRAAERARCAAADARRPAAERRPRARSRARARRAAAAARRAELRRLRGVGTPEAALRRALLSGRISALRPPPPARGPRGGAWRRAAALRRAARRARFGARHGRRPGRRRPPRPEPTATGAARARRNTETWTRAPFPAVHERRTFGRDPAVFQYYPGHGMQLQQLGELGPRQRPRPRLPERARSGRRGRCDERRLRQVLDRLAGLGARRGDFLAFEYYFQYGSGAPPWISGMAQATAVQALARAARALHSPRYTRIARQGAGRLPGAAARRRRRCRPTAAGASRCTRSRPTCGSSTASCRPSAACATPACSRAAASPAGSRAPATAPPARALAGFDTGAWSLYSARGREADLNYHRLTTEFLRDLCARFHHARYCRESKRFARYEREPPRIRIATLRGLRARRATTLRFSLSKVSTVTVRVFSRRGTLLLRRQFHLLPRRGTSSAGSRRRAGASACASTHRARAARAAPPRASCACVCPSRTRRSTATRRSGHSGAASATGAAPRATTCPQTRALGRSGGGAAASVAAIRPRVSAGSITSSSSNSVRGVERPGVHVRGGRRARARGCSRSAGSAIASSSSPEAEPAPRPRGPSGRARRDGQATVSSGSCRLPPTIACAPSP